MNHIEWFTSQHPDSFYYRCDLYEDSQIGLVAHIQDQNGEKSVTNAMEEVILDVLESLHTTMYDRGYETLGDLVESLLIVHTDSQGERAIVKYSFVDDFESEKVQPPISNVRWEPISKAMDILFLDMR